MARRLRRTKAQLGVCSSTSSRPNNRAGATRLSRRSALNRHRRSFEDSLGHGFTGDLLSLDIGLIGRNAKLYSCFGVNDLTLRNQNGANELSLT